MDSAQWDAALAVLGRPHPGALPSLAATVEGIRGAGGVLCEVIAGTPDSRYGARLTFRAARDRDPAAVARAAGFGDHPWGVPDWIGVRTAADGTTRCKAYHRRPPPLGRALIHRGLPDTCVPVMAALDDDGIEIYALSLGDVSWRAFADRCVGPVGGRAPDPGMLLSPRPRGFGVSVRHRDGERTRTTLFAMAKTLPSDERVTAAWTAAMTPTERDSFDLARAAVANLGRRPGRAYQLLAWNYTTGRPDGRAASLNVPPT